MNDFERSETRRENVSRMSRATLYQVRPTADDNMFIVESRGLVSARTHIVTLQDSDLFPVDANGPSLLPSGCTCEDYRFKKSENKGWCKHRIAAATAEGAPSMAILALMNPEPPPVLTVHSLAPDNRMAALVMDNLNMSFDNDLGRVVIAADATSVKIITHLSL